MTGGGRGAGQSTGSTGTLTPAGLGYFVRSITSLPRLAVPTCSRERRGEGRGKGISSVKRLLEVSQLLGNTWHPAAAADRVGRGGNTESGPTQSTRTRLVDIGSRSSLSQQPQDRRHCTAPEQKEDQHCRHFHRNAERRAARGCPPAGGGHSEPVLPIDTNLHP